MLGNIYDHITAEMEYPNGARCVSISGHIAHASERVDERIVGTKGESNCSGIIKGEKPYEYKGETPNPQVQEHADLIKSIRDGTPLNEGIRIAESTLTAVGIRMSAYTGRELSWDWLMNSSQLDLVPKDLKPGPGHFPPIAMPGITKLI
jgi:predicted dehydrogenase